MTQVKKINGIRIRVPDGNIPHILDKAQYKNDNWMRHRFCGLDTASIGKNITVARTAEYQSNIIAKVFAELFRISMAGGPCRLLSGRRQNWGYQTGKNNTPPVLEPGFFTLVEIINTQVSTKSANILGVGNNEMGSKSNRAVASGKHRRAAGTAFDHRGPCADGK